MRSSTQYFENTKDIYSNGETSARFVITGSETEPVIVNERARKRKRVKIQIVFLILSIQFV